MGATKQVPPTVLHMDFTIEHDDAERMIIITGKIGDFSRSISIPTPAYNVMMKFETEMPKQEAIQQIAQVMRWPIVDGKCKQAAMLIESVTPGYAAFNGWCALLIGTKQGFKRNNTFFEECSEVRNGRPTYDH